MPVTSLLHLDLSKEDPLLSMDLRNSSKRWLKDLLTSAVTLPWQSCLYVSYGVVGFPFAILLFCDQDPAILWHGGRCRYATALNALLQHTYMLSMEEQPRTTCSRKNLSAAVARAALPGHFFLLHPEHVPHEELVAPILPQDSRCGVDPLSVCADRLISSESHSVQRTLPRLTLPSFRPGCSSGELPGVWGPMPNLQCSLAGQLP